MKKVKLMLAVMGLMVLSSACGKADSAVMSESSARTESPMAPAFETAADSDAAFAGEPGEAAISSLGSANTIVNQAAAQERLIIRNGSLNIVVEDTEASMAAIITLAEGSGGWVVSSNVYQYQDDAKSGEVTLRIPASGFVNAIEAIKQMALEVVNESTSGQDVTDEFVDISARLTNLEATADRVRSFLEDASDVKDALAVNAELSRLEGEIEVLKGRRQYLEQSAAFSTLTVHLTPDILAQPIEVGGWKPQGEVKEAVQTLISTLQVLGSILIWLVIYLLPVLLIVGVPVFLFVRFIRARRQRRTAVTAEQ